MIISFTEFIDLIISILLVYIFVNRLFKLFMINHVHRRSINHYRKKYRKNIMDSTHDKGLVIQESTTYSTTAIMDFIDPPDTSDEESSTTNDSYYTSYNEVCSINDKQQSVLYAASKYAILSSIAIISTQLLLIAAVNNTLSFSGSDEWYYTTYNVYAILLPLDC
eukprot:176301_1